MRYDTGTTRTHSQLVVDEHDESPELRGDASDERHNDLPALLREVCGAYLLLDLSLFWLLRSN